MSSQLARPRFDQKALISGNTRRMFTQRVPLYWNAVTLDGTKGSSSAGSVRYANQRGDAEGQAGQVGAVVGLGQREAFLAALNLEPSANRP
jgi:hypothetical protein